MRESATVLTALLLRSASVEAATGDLLHEEVRELRRRVLSIDSFDRVAVALLAEEIKLRTRGLTELKQ